MATPSFPFWTSAASSLECRRRLCLERVETTTCDQGRPPRTDQQTRQQGRSQYCTETVSRIFHDSLGHNSPLRQLSSRILARSQFSHPSLFLVLVLVMLLGLFLPPPLVLCVSSSSLFHRGPHGREILVQAIEDPAMGQGFHLLQPRVQRRLCGSGKGKGKSGGEREQTHTREGEGKPGRKTGRKTRKKDEKERQERKTRKKDEKERHEERRERRKTRV